MKSRPWLAAVAIITGLSLLSGCGTKDKANSVTAVGSTALQPLVQKAGTDYQHVHPETNITVQGGGSGTGLGQVESGAVNIGNSDIFAQEKPGVTASKLKDHQVAVVGVVPVVNEKNGVKNLSEEQLQRIFTGKVKNWKEVGGHNVPIIVINRSQGSGTRKTFESKILHGQEAVKSQEQDSNGTVKKIVANTPGTISYLSLPYLSTDVQPVKINHVVANYHNITTNKWQLWSYEHMYTSKKPTEKTQKFIDYILSPATQQNLVRKAGYVSVHDMKVYATADGQIHQKQPKKGVK